MNPHRRLIRDTKVRLERARRKVERLEDLKEKAPDTPGIQDKLFYARSVKDDYEEDIRGLGGKC